MNGEQRDAELCSDPLNIGCQNRRNHGRECNSCNSKKKRLPKPPAQTGATPPLPQQLPASAAPAGGGGALMELRSTVHEMKTELETLRKQRHDEEQAVDGGAGRKVSLAASAQPGSGPTVEGDAADAAAGAGAAGPSSNPSALDQARMQQGVMANKPSQTSTDGEAAGQLDLGGGWGSVLIMPSHKLKGLSDPPRIAIRNRMSDATRFPAVPIDKHSDRFYPKEHAEELNSLLTSFAGKPVEVGFTANSTSDLFRTLMDHYSQALDIRLGYSALTDPDADTLINPTPPPIQGTAKVLFLHAAVWGSSDGGLGRHSFSKYTLPEDGYLQRWAKQAGRVSVWDPVIEHADCPMEWSASTVGPSAADGEATFHAAYLEAEIAKARQLVAFAEAEAARLGIAASTQRCPMPDEEDLRKYGQEQYDKLREKHQTVDLWCGALEQLKTLLRWRAAAGEQKHETTKDFCEWLELRFEPQCMPVDKDPIVMVYLEMWAIPGGGHWVPREVVKVLARVQKKFNITVIVDEAFTAFRSGKPFAWMHYDGFYPDGFLTGKPFAAMFVSLVKSLFKITDFRATHRLVERTVYTQWDLEDLSGKHAYVSPTANPGLNFWDDAAFYHHAINFTLRNFYTAEEYAQIKGAGLIRFFPPTVYLLSPRSQVSPAVMSHGGTGSFYRAVFPIGTRPAFTDMLLKAFPPILYEKDTAKDILRGADGEQFIIDENICASMKATMLGAPKFWLMPDGGGEAGLGRKQKRKKAHAAAAGGGQQSKKAATASGGGGGPATRSGNRSPAGAGPAYNAGATGSN